MKPNLKNITGDIFPGFVVSLIALPLCLGLALASGAPPIAGVVAAVAGGLVVSILGGSNVTITGPGNGMVAATFAAITTLGGGDPIAGYLFTLGAVVVSGVFLFLFGLFRFGALGDFFPSAAVQGMLAAIGLIIMGKQLHIMLGETNPDGQNVIALFMEFPNTLGKLFNGELPVLAWVVGIVSLLLMILYPKIHNKWLRRVPAPLWIVLLAVGSTYFSRSHPETIAPLSSELLINIPDNVIKELRFPDFGKIGHFDFWTAAFSLTFIAGIESLLSIKAVDKLDPKKRRSNVNKDLRALGTATVVSGLLGGLNVATVIARSSVNVNNGAATRWSNFFHGIFLLAFVIFLAPFLQKTPLPALAAILVFTGYKLAEPRVFISIAKVGWAPLLVFLITLFTTLFTNLITGIVAGIFATLVLQAGIIQRFKLVARYVFRPNTLLYQEKEKQYHLSVRAFSNFVNFMGMKKKLDSLPRDAKVIVDFSLAQFVDHSVMERLEDYYHSFRGSGGDLEIVGLDKLAASSEHPLAARLPQGARSTGGKSLNQRQKAMKQFAKKLGWTYQPIEFFYREDFSRFQYFEHKIIDRGRNRLHGEAGKIDIVMADLDYHEGEFIMRETLHSTMVALKMPAAIPKFTMDKENLLHRVAHLAGFDDIHFPKHPDFSKAFELKSDETEKVMQFFDDDLIDFFQSNKSYHVESNGLALLLFEKERVATLREIKQLVSFANRLAVLLDEKFE